MGGVGASVRKLIDPHIWAYPLEGFPELSYI